MDSPSNSEATVGQKRTRNGETFIDPSEVTLHCHDFSFDTLKASVVVVGSSTQKGFHEAPGASSKVEGEDNEAFSFIYYGDIMWPATGAVGAPACPLTSFQQLHDRYAAECMSLLRATGSASSSAPQQPPAVCNSSSSINPQMAVPPESPWERHYELTTNTFFPIKNYIHRAFPTMLSASSSPPRFIMECGCGNGSAVLAFLKHSPNDCYACFDISDTAVKLLADHPIAKQFKEDRTKDGAPAKGTGPLPLLTFTYDICDLKYDLDESFLNRMAGDKGRYTKGTVDQLMLIFVLCALPSVSAMRLALRRLAYWLRPGSFQNGEWTGGRLLFRDYAVLDHNMLRFLERPTANGDQKQVDQHIPFFLKGDGTSQFFFERQFTESNSSRRKAWFRSSFRITAMRSRIERMERLCEKYSSMPSSVSKFNCKILLLYYDVARWLCEFLVA